MNPNNDAADEIEFEFFPFIRIYKSGRKERFYEPDFLPARLDPDTDVLSKDVVISSDTAVSARLYLPHSSLLQDGYKKHLPILIYFHGGGFVLESAFSSSYHHYLNSLVAKSNVLAVSVDYRRVPEHPIPAAYDDSWLAVQWVASAVDPWLAEHGDYSRVFMAGDSAGANLAHHVAMRVGADGVHVKGIALVNPMFVCGELTVSEGKYRTECLGEFTKGLHEMLKGRGWRGEVEPLGDGREIGEMMDVYWRCMCSSKTTGLDDPLINPVSERGPGLDGLACDKVLVFTSEKDFLGYWERDYYERLKKSGWKGEAELFETEGENHCFHLFNPTCERALALMERMVDFLK